MMNMHRLSTLILVILILTGLATAVVVNIDGSNLTPLSWFTTNNTASQSRDDAINSTKLNKTELNSTIDKNLSNYTNTPNFVTNATVNPYSFNASNATSVLPNASAPTTMANLSKNNLYTDSTQSYSYSDTTRNIRLVDKSGTFYIVEYQAAGDVTGYSNPGSAIVYYGKITSTGRSINAVGTINANGADYAEYISYPIQTSIGDIIKVYNRYMIVSNPLTAAFVGGDGNQTNKTLVSFSGQVQTKVIGTVNEGDYIIPFGSAAVTYGYAVKQSDLTLPLYIKAVGIAWQNSTDVNLKMINVAVGIK